MGDYHYGYCTQAMMALLNVLTAEQAIQLHPSLETSDRFFDEFSKQNHAVVLYMFVNSIL